MNIGPDVRDGPAYIACDQVQERLCLGREMAARQVFTEHQDGQIDAGEKIGEVAVDRCRLKVAGRDGAAEHAIVSRR